jgi:hypothetical protein
MKVDLDYLVLPSLREPYPRPIVNVQIEDMVEAPLACIVNSGAVYNRFPADFADAAGIDLDEPDATDVFYSGGEKHDGPIVPVRLRIGPLDWEAPVCFVRDWGYDFGILGHEGFFRWFHVCFRAVNLQLSLEMVDR